jgi:hypothetical protein
MSSLRNAINNAFVSVAKGADPSYVPPPPPPRQDNSASRFSASRTINNAFKGIADAVQASARGGPIRDYAVRPSLGIIPDNVEFAKRGRKAKARKSIKSNVSQKQNVNIKINIGDQLERAKEVIQKELKRLKTPVKRVAKRKPIDKVARDDSVLVQKERRTPAIQKMSVGNTTRLSNPGLLFGQPGPINVFNPRVSGPIVSDFPGAGSTPNPYQRTIKVEDGNINQPQLQTVNPNDIEPVLVSMRMTPSRPSPAMELFPSSITASSSSSSYSPIFSQTPQYNYNKAKLMVPRSAVASFYVPANRMIDDDIDYNEYNEDYGTPPILNPRSSPNSPPFLEPFGSYEDDDSMPYAREVGHPMSASARYKKRRGGLC